MSSLSSFASRRQVLALSASALVAAVAGGCSPPPAPQRFNDLHFTHLQPLVFKAAQVDVREDYRPPMRPPNVEHEMPLSPMGAARQWAFERLQADGTAGRSVVLSIQDGAVTEKSLAVQKGVEGAFRTEQAERYDASLEATLQVIDTTTGVTMAQATARVWRFATVPENASVQDREAAWFTLIQGLMSDFNARMEQSIRTYASGALVR
ncbi:hypothetical protein [Pararhodospirillum oryzae]|uniref:Lipoprotein n=1 Tax=Pararhodospirillum oryzae TaxID=478448 RepID=A0A512H4E9_9PROT|nr:hypothetical protein [Pararhodospirillum oryzae]GEO80311.1 hypothetical protein ROR02_04420 [Pararhodospirillum oryzae]